VTTADWDLDPVYDFQFRPGEDIDIPACDVEAARRFRDVLGTFASGVTVVTGMVDGQPAGFTCQSFSSVSLNPPLVLVVPSKTSRAFPGIRSSGRFAVNILAEDQQEMSSTFASRGVDKFAGLDWRPSPVSGSPLLPGIVSYVDCRVHKVHDAGDHHVVIGRVLDMGIADEDEPLLFFRGGYRGVS
jgi:3-hydroxy-9,10-secoandrosta-1,3,5(10)-triene-9,17-dione monooxygenase reductase component